jgi:hypothetical protein
MRATGSCTYRRNKKSPEIHFRLSVNIKGDAINSIPLYVFPANVPDPTFLLLLSHWWDRRRDSSHKTRTQQSGKGLICHYSSGIRPGGRHSHTPRSLRMWPYSLSPYTFQNHLLVVMPAQNTACIVSMKCGRLINGSRKRKGLTATV